MAGTKPLLLGAPAAGTARLAGQVRLDPLNVTRLAAGAQLVGLDGGSLVGMDGSTLVDGATLVDRGGQVIARAGARFAVPAGLIGLDGSTLIGNDGSTLVGLDGSTLIGNDGSTLIGNDGSTLIGNDGSTLVGNDGSTYRLAQAGPADGAAVPAAGMWVSVIDTRTGFTVPIGSTTVQEGGKPVEKPVFTVYTDARGGFEVHPPADVVPYARVVARAPGGRDAGLTLNLLTRAAGPGDLRVDADAGATTKFLRTIFGGRMDAILTTSPEEVAMAFTDIEAGKEVREGNKLKLILDSFGRGGVAELQAAYRASQGELLSPALRAELGRLMADRVLAELDLRQLVINREFLPDEAIEPGLDGKPVLAELQQVLEHIREAARAQLADQADPVAYFAAKPYLQEYNLRQPPAGRVRIAHADDLVDFVQRTYLSNNNDHEYAKVYAVLHDLYPSLPERFRQGLDPQALEILDRNRLRFAGVVVTVAFVAKLFTSEGTDGKSLTPLLAKLIADANERLITVPPAAEPPARPAPPVPTPPPAEPAWEVTTVAGLAGVPDVTDGPGPAARFTSPRGLWVDPVADPPILFVADAGNGLIRKLVFDAAGAATVSTVAGVVLPDPKTGKPIGARLAQDGPPGVGCFVMPSDLAFAPDGKLYVVDTAMQALRRVNFDKGAAAADVETVAGGLAGGIAVAGEAIPDGPGLAARFASPLGLLLDGAGGALVADSSHFAIRRVALREAGFPVTRFAGVGSPGLLDGPLRKADGSFGARLLEVFDMARAPDGAIWLVEGGQGPIRRITPDGTAIAQIAGGAIPQGDRIDQPAFGLSAKFDFPNGLAVTSDGDAIVADTLNHRIRRVRPDGWVTTVAGGGPTGVSAGAWADGTGTAARFKTPWAVAIAPDGSIFVADDSHTIRRLRRR